MLLVSMSLLMYDDVGHTGECVLLNNKGFSPCAVIAAYQSSEPSARTVIPLNISKEAYPDRYIKMQEMGYDGNRLLRELGKRTEKIRVKRPMPAMRKETPPEVILRQKISF